MIKIYMSPSCASCRKVKAWFDEKKIPYTEVNILKHQLTEEDLRDMLIKSLNGTDDIISTRSKIIKEQHVDIDSMSIKELYRFILDNPTVLKRPIIVDDEKIQVGYNSDEIEIFEKAKRIMADTCRPEGCDGFEDCEHPYEGIEVKKVDEHNYC